MEATTGTTSGKPTVTLANSENANEVERSGSQNRKPVRANHAIELRGGEDGSTEAGINSNFTDATNSADSNLPDENSQRNTEVRTSRVGSLTVPVSSMSLNTTTEARVTQADQAAKSQTNNHDENQNIATDASSSTVCHTTNMLEENSETILITENIADESSSRVGSGWLKPRRASASPANGSSGIASGSNANGKSPMSRATSPRSTQSSAQRSSPSQRALSPLHQLATRSKSPRGTSLGSGAGGNGSAFGIPSSAHGKLFNAAAAANGLLHAGRVSERSSGPVSFVRGSNSQLRNIKGTKVRLSGNSPKTTPPNSNSTFSATGTTSAAGSMQGGDRAGAASTAAGGGASSASTSNRGGMTHRTSTSETGASMLFLSDEQLQDPTPRDLEFLTARNADDMDGPLEVEMPGSTTPPNTLYASMPGGRNSSVPATAVATGSGRGSGGSVHSFNQSGSDSGRKDLGFRGRPGSPLMTNQTRHRSSSWDSPRRESDQLAGGISREDGVDVTSSAGLGGWPASKPVSPDAMWHMQHQQGSNRSTPNISNNLNSDMANFPANVLSMDAVANMTLGEIESLQKMLDEYKVQLLRSNDNQSGRVGASTASFSSNPRVSGSSSSGRPVTPLRSHMGEDHLSLSSMGYGSGEGSSPVIAAANNAYGTRIPSPNAMGGGVPTKVTHPSSPVMVTSVLSDSGAGGGLAGIRRGSHWASAAGSRRGRQRSHRSLARSASPVLKGTLRRKMSKDDAESIVSEGLEEVVGLTGKVEEDFDDERSIRSGGMAPDTKMFRSSQPRTGSAELSSDGGGVDSESEWPSSSRGATLSSSPGNISFVSRIRPSSTTVTSSGGVAQTARMMVASTAPPWEVARQLKEHAASQSGVDLLSPDPTKGVDCISSPRSAFIPAQQ